MNRATIALSMSLLLGLTFAIEAHAQSERRAGNSADSVPKYDIAEDCKAPNASTGLTAGLDQTISSCMDDERRALSELQRDWAKYKLSDRIECINETADTGADLRSYVELLTCIQMAQDAAE